ncbi:hypothetical protein F2P81_012506 [Scophthalmus maximus]|uniref:Uncharacterized protein n=1 Tax=Scophthalmus maximus TaxID=52904 RepID=A0A6A4SRK1_SCOMX|nr:hypothetical protein F2P81_012506 [Scophthalmus maximus]
MQTKASFTVIPHWKVLMKTTPPISVTLIMAVSTQHIASALSRSSNKDAAGAAGPETLRSSHATYCSSRRQVDPLRCSYSVKRSMTRVTNKETPSVQITGILSEAGGKVEKEEEEEDDEEEEEEEEVSLVEEHLNT